MRATILFLAGELDANTRSSVRSTLTEAFRKHPHDRLIVDMADVTFFDCATISELLAARQAFRQAGGDLVLRGVSPHGRKLLAMLRLDNLNERVARRRDILASAGATAHR